MLSARSACLRGPRTPKSREICAAQALLRDHVRIHQSSPTQYDENTEETTYEKVNLVALGRNDGLRVGSRG